MLLTSPSEVAMSVTTVVPKPSLLTVNRKVPSANSGKLKFPVPSVVTVRSCPVVGFESLIVAPGTTAPWASRTVPVIRPGNCCPNKLPTARVITATNNETERENAVLRLAMVALLKRLRAKRYPSFVCYVKIISSIYQSARTVLKLSKTLDHTLAFRPGPRIDPRQKFYGITYIRGLRPGSRNVAIWHTLCISWKIF